MGGVINQCIKYQDTYKLLLIFNSIIYIPSFKYQFKYNKRISFIVNIICSYEVTQIISKFLPIVSKDIIKAFFGMTGKPIKGLNKRYLYINHWAAYVEKMIQKCDPNSILGDDK